MIIMLVYYRVFGPHEKLSKNKTVSLSLRVTRGLALLNLLLLEKECHAL